MTDMTNISKFSIKQLKQIVSTSAIMALEEYSDLYNEETGEQMSVEDKCDIIRCNEHSWLIRVIEVVNLKS